MTWLLAVDPGLRLCGAALFMDGVLQAAAVVKNPVPKGDSSEACKAMADAVATWAFRGGIWMGIAVERMQSYTAGHQKGDQNDLITLGIIAGMLRPTHLYRPAEWKGQLPKPERRSESYILEARVRERLSALELEQLPANLGPAWDVVDAIGIGLHHLGRLERRRVFAR